MALFLFRRRLSTLSQLFPDPSSISYSAALSRLKFVNNPDQIVTIFDSISGDAASSVARHARDLAVKILAKNQKFSEIEAIVEKQKQICKTPNEKFFISTIHCYGKAGLIDHAIQTFNQMEELGVSRSVLSFNALLSACNKAKKFDQVPKLFSEIPQNFKISPDKISYGILIRSLCESGSVESAYSILEEMEQKNVEITAVIFATLLHGCYKNNLPEKAEEIWVEMGRKGCSPDVDCYNVRILYSVRGGNVEEALRLMGEMVSFGLKPNTNSYNLLMACYCKNGMIEEAKKVFKDMEANGCASNSATFNYIVYYLCKNGDYVMGLFLAKECMKQKKDLGIGSLKCLIEGLLKDSKLKGSKRVIGDAKWLIGVAKKRFPRTLLSELERLDMGLDAGGFEVSEEKPESSTGVKEIKLLDYERKLDMGLGIEEV